VLTGEYKNTIDEKGRIMIPSKIRNEIEGNMLVVTRGVEKCLWMFTPDEWAKISESIMGSTSLFKSKTRLLQRRIVAPAQECEIDKAGRINIPPSLRTSAGLTKETIVLGVEKYIEVWDEQEYATYLDSSEEDFIEAAEELDDILTNM
jgi:MraZ protein